MSEKPCYEIEAEERELLARYGHLFQNTGGNDIEELLTQPSENIQTNAVVAMLQMSCADQLSMLKVLQEKNLLVKPSDLGFLF